MDSQDAALKEMREIEKNIAIKNRELAKMRHKLSLLLQQQEAAEGDKEKKLAF